jgi:hypothetical protein
VDLKPSPQTGSFIEWLITTDPTEINGEDEGENKNEKNVTNEDLNGLEGSDTDDSSG